MKKIPFEIKQYVRRRVDESPDTPSLPPGGQAGQILVKQSSVNGDAAWGDMQVSFKKVDGGTSAEPHASGWGVDGGTE